MTVKHRRSRGDGSYRRRGDSWELKFNATDPKTGLRASRFVTFKGSETGARTKLRELLKQADDGAFIAPARQTFGEVLDAWSAGLHVSPKTAERYRELAKLHIRPHLGGIKLQALRTSRIESFYTDLRDGKSATAQAVPCLAPRTIGHIHRLVVQALAVAERDGSIPSNPARVAKRPKIEREEVEILSEAQIKDVLRKLRGVAFYRLAALGISTGLRRGELLALRWRDIDLDGASLRVEQSPARLDHIADLFLAADSLMLRVNGKWEKEPLPSWLKVAVAKAFRQFKQGSCWRTDKKDGDLRVCLLPNHHYGNHRMEVVKQAHQLLPETNS